MALALALILTACGSGDDGARPPNPTWRFGPPVPAGTYTRQLYVDALASGLTTNFVNLLGDNLKPDAVRCTADRWVSEMGLGRLEAAGVTPVIIGSSAFSPAGMGLVEDETQVMAEALSQCGIDLSAMVATLLSAQPDANSVACVLDAIKADPSKAERILAVMMARGAEDPRVPEGMAEITEPCGLVAEPSTTTAGLPAN